MPSPANLARFYLASLLCVCFASAQDLILRPSTETTDLKLVSIGNGKLKSGERTGNRVYEAPDGTKGNVFYVSFSSPQAAQQLIEKWVKVSSKITSRKQDQINKKGQLVSDRVLAIQTLPETHQEESVIIRRDGLDCYLIESVSLKVATEIEDLIYHR